MLSISIASALEVNSFEDDYVVINFSSTITTDVTNLSTVIITAPNYVSIDTNTYPEFNVSAIIILKNVAYPSICPETTAFNTANMRHYFPLNESSGTLIHDYGTSPQDAVGYNITWATGLNEKPAVFFDNSIVAYILGQPDDAWMRYSASEAFTYCTLIKASPVNHNQVIWNLGNPIPPSDSGGSAWGFSTYYEGSPTPAGLAGMGRNSAGGGIWAYNKTIGITDNEWHHVCSQFNNDGVFFYVDGQKINNDQNSGALFQRALGLPVIFGANDVDKDNRLNGSLSDMRFYRTSTTDSNIVDIYRVSTCNPITKAYVKKDGVLCSGVECPSIDLYNGVATFNVTGFSTYSITNTTSMNITYNTPANGTTITNNNVTFDWNITSDAGVNTTTIVISNDTGVYYTNTYSGGGSNNINFNKVITLPFYMEYTWYITAKDMVENTFTGGTESFEVEQTTYFIIADYSYPIISQAGQVAEDTSSSIAGTTSWFPIIITLSVIVGVIILTMIMIKVMKDFNSNVGGTA